MATMSRQEIVRGYAEGRITAIDARRRLGNVTYGELFRMLADAGLTLPSIPTEGRQESLARAREWLLPRLRGDG